MNYTEHLNRFWRLDEERAFTTAETRMYLQLLNMFSRVGFDRTISMCNALAVGLFGISLCTYKSALHTLVERGLITVEYRKEHRRRCAVFALATQQPAETPTDTDPDTEPVVDTSIDADADIPAQLTETRSATQTTQTEPIAPAPLKPLPPHIRLNRRQRRRQTPRTKRRP